MDRGERFAFTLALRARLRQIPDVQVANRRKVNSEVGDFRTVHVQVIDVLSAKVQTVFQPLLQLRESEVRRVGLCR